jgi:uncharacterized protein with PIN domain
MKKASETLVSRKTGTEYDLCPTCESELEEILQGKPKEEVKRGRKPKI